MSDTSNVSGDFDSLAHAVATEARVLFGKRIHLPALGAAQRGVVVSATASAVVVSIPTYSATATFSATYQPLFSYPAGISTQLIPPAGTECLVVFAGSGIGDAWVVAFANWP